jgi:hypothetical protein
MTSRLKISRGLALISAAETLRPQLTAPYLYAYSRHGGITGDRVSRWLPFIAAARLAEGVTSETDRLLKMVTER